MHDTMIVDFDRDERLSLLRAHADDWLALAIENILREYPHMPWIIANAPEDYRLHRESHPVFFGSFDWHSCVEMYWTAARLMRLFPGLPHEDRAREVINGLLTAENIATEAAYFHHPGHRGFERPYGWGWLLTLWHEVAIWDDEDARRWQAALTPLAETLMDRFAEWLPRMTYPQRIGMHSNTAFGMTLSWSAVASQRPELLELFRERAITWFESDTNYPAHYEPSGADFLSAGLIEAVLMALVLPSDQYRSWLSAFLPGMQEHEPASLFTPAVVTDASDGQIAHLHGLNLSRAWSFLVIGDHLPQEDARHDALRYAARLHSVASLGEVDGSDYMVEHWLVAYATLLLSS